MVLHWTDDHLLPETSVASSPVIIVENNQGFLYRESAVQWHLKPSENIFKGYSYSRHSATEKE